MRARMLCRHWCEKIAGGGRENRRRGGTMMRKVVNWSRKAGMGSNGHSGLT